MLLTYESIAKRIDHSLLGPTLTGAELEAGCRLAAEYQVASVCIKPYARICPATKKILAGSGVAVPAPRSASRTAATPPRPRSSRSKQAMDDGATELDMVVNIGQALGGEWRAVSDDIEAVTEVAHKGGAIVKVIFENCYLNDEQKTKLCALCGEHRADYVKTSTGYGTGGSTDADLILMQQGHEDTSKLKAAGGIRDLDGAIRVAEARLRPDRALSRTFEILDALKARLAGRTEPTAAPRGTDGY